jgi:hypothetical protein
LGNSFVANRVEAESKQLKQAAKPAAQPASAVDPDTGKFSPISETEAWSLERAIKDMNAREQAAQAMQAANAAPASTPGWVNDDLLNYELGHYFDSVDEFNFTINKGLMADVDSSLLVSALQRSNSPGPWMDGYGFPNFRVRSCLLTFRSGGKKQDLTLRAHLLHRFLPGTLSPQGAR